MLLTSVLMFLAMREIWRWSLPREPRGRRSFRLRRRLLRRRQFREILRGRLDPDRRRRFLYFLMTSWSQGYAAHARRPWTRHLPALGFHHEIP